MVLENSNHTLPPNIILLLPEIPKQIFLLSLPTSKKLTNQSNGTMMNEYNALISNQTWVLVPRQSHMNVIGCKWIFK